MSGGDSEFFSLAPDTLAPLKLGLKNTHIAAISPKGEMLLIQQRRPVYAFARVGLLASAPLTGAAPRPLLSDVQDADWGPDNQIAVAHYVGQRYRLEYPVGHVLYETKGYISDVRVSPKGDVVAFAGPPIAFDRHGRPPACVPGSGLSSTA